MTYSNVQRQERSFNCAKAKLKLDWSLSYSYKLRLSRLQQVGMSSRTQLLTPSNLRLDSRLPLELRALSLSILPSPAVAAAGGGIATAGCDGYSSCSHGLTRVTSSVFGPREPSRTGPFSAGDQAPTGGRSEGKAQVNVQVGTAGWAERGQGTGNGSVTAGVRKGGKDRSVEGKKSLDVQYADVRIYALPSDAQLSWPQRSKRPLSQFCSCICTRARQLTSTYKFLRWTDVRQKLESARVTPC